MSRFVPAFLAFLFALTCPGYATRPAEPFIESVTVTFEDSAGGLRKTLSPDSLPKNLRAYLDAIRARRPGRAHHIALPGESQGIEALLDGCMCESPSDSVLIRFADGTREAYQIYCDAARRLQGTVPYGLDFPNDQREMLAGRWRSLRRRFCPNRYGCSDVAPAKWHFYVERRIPTGWEATDDIDMMARHWANVLDSIGASVPEVALSLSLHSRHGKACFASDFRVPPGYNSLLPAFIRRVGKSGIGFTARKAGEYRINAYNFDNEP